MRLSILLKQAFVPHTLEEPRTNTEDSGESRVSNIIAQPDHPLLASINPRDHLRNMVQDSGYEEQKEQVI